MRLLNSVGLVGAGFVAMAAGCHLIVGIRDDELYEPDAGVNPPECTPDQVQDCAVSSSSTGGGGQGGGTGGAGGVMCDPDTGIGCGVHVWSRIFGDTSFEDAFAIASDAQGNVYVAGSFYGTIQLGGMPLISAGSDDVFLAKFDPAGNHVWSQRFGDASGGLYIYDLAVDSDGNAAITGPFPGGVDFGDGFIQGDHDMFVAKFDTNGDLLWAGGYGDLSWSQSGSGVAIDGSGNVVVLGSFLGTLGPLTATGDGGTDIFLIKFSSLEGDILWAKRFGDAGDQTARAIAIDSSDSIVMVGGKTSGALNFGGSNLDGNIFLARFDANGNHNWSTGFNSSISGSASDVAVDSFGNAVLAGSFKGTVDIGGKVLTSTDGFSMYLVKYNWNIGVLWSEQYGSLDFLQFPSVAVDAVDEIVLAGTMSEAVDFGGGALPFGGLDDVFLAKFNPEGAHRWSRSFGDENYQKNASVAATGSDVLLICSAQGTIDFGGGPLTSAGASDVAVAKFTH